MVWYCGERGSAIKYTFWRCDRYTVPYRTAGCHTTPHIAICSLPTWYLLRVHRLRIPDTHESAAPDSYLQFTLFLRWLRNLWQLFCCKFLVALRPPGFSDFIAALRETRSPDEPIPNLRLSPRALSEYGQESYRDRGSSVAGCWLLYRVWFIFPPAAAFILV